MNKPTLPEPRPLDEETRSILRGLREKELRHELLKFMENMDGGSMQVGKFLAHSLEEHVFFTTPSRSEVNRVLRKAEQDGLVGSADKGWWHLL